jgi:glutathione S-transferase
MRLYGGIHSGYTQKVRVALAEKALTGTIPFVDVPKAERGPLHARARNVLRLVPILELDDGTFLNESSAIIEYLDARTPSSKVRISSATSPSPTSPSCRGSSCCPRSASKCRPTSRA